MPQLLYARGKQPWYKLNMRLDESQRRSERVWREKSIVLLGTGPPFLGRPGHSIITISAMLRFHPRSFINSYRWTGMTKTRNKSVSLRNASATRPEKKIRGIMLRTDSTETVAGETSLKVLKITNNKTKFESCRGKGKVGPWETSFHASEHH